MKSLALISFASFLTTALGEAPPENTPPPNAPAPPPAAEDQGVPWAWRTDPSAAAYTTALTKQGYTVETKELKWSDTSFTVKNPDGKLLHTWKGHNSSAFLVANGVLYIAEYSIASTSIKIVAIDANTSAEKWQRAMPPVVLAHSKYRNAVNLEFKDGTLRVFSKQSAGQGQFWWVLSALDGAVLESHPAEHFAAMERAIADANKRFSELEKRRTDAKKK